jgi:dTMP kinase
VVESADGVGGTTQCEQLVHRRVAAGRKVHLTKEPSEGPIGKLIRQMLGSDRPRRDTHRELALLFAADRLDHLGREVEPRLADGFDVISDRYVLSSLVYQSLDLPFEWVRDLNKHAPQPDTTILITLPLDVAWARLEARLKAGAKQEIFDQRTTQVRIHTEYERLAKRFSALFVDGLGTVEEVGGRVQAAMETANQW